MQRLGITEEGGSCITRKCGNKSLIEKDQPEELKRRWEPIYGELLVYPRFLGIAVLARMLRCAISSSFSFMSLLRSLDSWVRAESVLSSPSLFSSNNNS
jgi:hypothetical protein